MHSALIPRVQKEIMSFNGKGSLQFLASQDAIEVMSVTDSLIVSTDLTDVTLVSDDTYRRLY